MVGSGSECTWGAWRSSPGTQKTDKALYMSLATVCKNEAPDVVNTVTHKRGFESWRKLCKEKGRRLGRRARILRIFLEYDFGTTDGVKKKLLKWVEVSRTNQDVFASS